MRHSQGLGVSDNFSRDQIFALVDCNNFYVSCERIFMPRCKGQPVIVLSNNDGCVVALSEEAKAVGIIRGTPLFKCEKLIENYNIHVFSSNYTLYGDISKRVMEILSQFTPNLEIYSIDEAFLSLNGFKFRDITQYAGNIRTTVMKWIGIPVSIGIGPTKTLAKIAARKAKKEIA